MTARIRAEVFAGGVETPDQRHVIERADALLAELFGSQPTSPSLYARLHTLYAQCDASRGEWSALAPAPDVNRCLRRLVGIVRGEHGDTDRFEEADSFAVALSVERRIASDPELSRKAALIRCIAAHAETQLEYHYSTLLVSRLQTESGELRARTRDPLELLRRVLVEFPYVESYVELVLAELRLLQRPVPPLFLRDRSAARLSGPARAALRALQLEAAAWLSAPLQLGALADKTLAVCGCGPLPISGLMLQLVTGASVVLIDSSAQALEQARALVDGLARVGVLRREAFRFVQADAAALRYGRYGRGLLREDGPPLVECDAVVVASLIPLADKRRLAQDLRESVPVSPLAVVMRSAGGLCAELIYEAVPTEQLSDLRLIYCGESVPKHQLLESLDAGASARLSRSALGSRELLAVADTQVLNSSELYYRIPCSMPNDPLASALRPWSAQQLELGRQLLRA